MVTLKTDSPLSRRIVRSFLQFLQDVEPSPGVDTEALDVAKECLAEVFQIDQSSVQRNSNDSLIDIFSPYEPIARRVENNAVVSDVPTTSSGKDAEVLGDSRPSFQEQHSTDEPHSPGGDELFGQFLGALEKFHYFRRMPDGHDDQFQLDRATSLFHKAVEQMRKAGCQAFDRKSLAETFKSEGNKVMQSKLYADAIELYTFAIALYENNAVYYCNRSWFARAAAYTQTCQYDAAVRDCLKSLEVDPSYSKAYSRLGFAYYAQGKYRDAVEKGFKKALELDPNNQSAKENIRVAEEKLKEEQRRGGPNQSSTSTSNGQSSHHYGGGPRTNSGMPPQFTSMPFNIDGLPADITSMLRGMAGNAFPGQPFEGTGEGDGWDGGHDQPGMRMDGNINLNFNELPEELSGVLHSMMGMFSGGTSQQRDQQDSGNDRPNAS